MIIFLQNKESLPLIKMCNYLKLRRHFVLMIEGKQSRRRENELLCLAKVTMLSEKVNFLFPKAVAFSSKNTMHLILNEFYGSTLNFEV